MKGGIVMWGLLKAIPLKAFAYAAILSMVLGAAWKLQDSIWTSGYNQAQLEFQDESVRIANAAVEKAREQWGASAKAAEAQILVEEKIVEEIRVIEKEIPVVVETVVPECRTLGPAVLGVYNKAINAANNQPKDTAATP